MSLEASWHSGRAPPPIETPRSQQDGRRSAVVIKSNPIRTHWVGDSQTGK